MFSLEYFAGLVLLAALTATNAEFICVQSPTRNIKWRLFEGKCYALTENRLNSSEGLTQCKALSGEPAEISTKKIETFLKENILDNQDAWILNNTVCEDTAPVHQGSESSQEDGKQPTCLTLPSSSDDNDCGKENCADKLHAVCQKSADIKSKGCVLPEGESFKEWTVNGDTCIFFWDSRKNYFSAKLSCQTRFGGNMAYAKTQQALWPLKNKVNSYGGIGAWIRYEGETCPLLRAVGNGPKIETFWGCEPHNPFLCEVKYNQQYWIDRSLSSST